jgi:hypothetical protein
MGKKTEKPIKKNQKKNNQKNRLKFWNNWPVRFGFGFISLKPKKLNRTQTGKKPSQTRKNRAKLEKTEPKPNQTWFEPVFSLKNQTESNQTKTGRLNRFRFSFVFFFKKIWFDYFFQ